MTKVEAEQEKTEAAIRMPNPLPIGWEWKQLGTICKTTSGGTPQRKTAEYFKGVVPWLKSGELRDGQIFKAEEHISEAALANSNAKVFPEGTVLVALYGATVGRVGLLKIPAATNQAVCAVFPPDSLQAEFLFWFFRSIRSLLVAQSVGGAQPNISQGILRDIPIPIPPLDMQKRIVAEIEKQFSRLDEAVTNLKRVKANLKRYRASVLKAAVEGRLVETEAEVARREGREYESGAQLLERILETRRRDWKGKGQYKEPAAPDVSELPDLPEGWAWGTVEQMAEVKLGKMLDQKKKKIGQELPYLRNINVRWGAIDLTDLATMFFADDELSRFDLQEGDILICEGGEPGRAAVWNGNHPNIKFQKALHRVRYYLEQCPEFLVFFLEFYASTGRLSAWFTGSTIKHFTRESFILLPIPLPPLAEQQRIVAEVDRRLSLVRETEAQVEANLKRAERLRQSVLQKAFSGELVRDEAG